MREEGKQTEIQLLELTRKHQEAQAAYAVQLTKCAEAAAKVQAIKREGAQEAGQGTATDVPSPPGSIALPVQLVQSLEQLVQQVQQLPAAFCSSTHHQAMPALLSQAEGIVQSVQLAVPTPTGSSQPGTPPTLLPQTLQPTGDGGPSAATAPPASQDGDITIDILQQQ